MDLGFAFCDISFGIVSWRYANISIMNTRDIIKSSCFSNGYVCYSLDACSFKVPLLTDDLHEKGGEIIGVAMRTSLSGSSCAMLTERVIFRG